MNVIENALLKRYFELAGKENIPNTKEITAEADELEREIRKLRSYERNER